MLYSSEFPDMTLRHLFFISTLLPVLCLHFTKAVADDSLRPLPFNNPSLHVDLGVGLWAWPMPMDYDGDGDHDLLVACPDKPSNGVYLFENTTQDRHQSTPIFEKAVRLGPATQNMQVSYVEGTPRILVPGKEANRDDRTNQFDFKNLTTIYSKTNIHPSPVRGNMWRYVDFDGDGNHDIVVGAGDWTDFGWDHAYNTMGEWKNGPLHGYVYLIHNTGTDRHPSYSETPRRIRAGGGDIDVYGWPSPNFGDFDSDGDLDLICGEFLDGFTYFQNLGTRSRPDYAAGVRLRCTDGQRLRMHLQMITPTAFDWDTDGDLDLIVGDEDGRVAFVEHQGTDPNGIPQFSDPFYFQQKADTLKFGALATPCAYDIDSDGDEDIVCGNTAGNIAIFKNLGCLHDTLPTWSAPKLIQTMHNGAKSPFRVMAGDNGSIQGPCESKWGYTTLSVGDWDNDGDGDILFNSILSRLGLLIRENTYYKQSTFDAGPYEQPPEWYWWKGRSTASLTQWRTTPVMVDFDGDTFLDLILLDQEGYLTLRRRDPRTKGVGKAQRCFIDTQGNAICLNPRSAGRSGRVKLTVVDWDGDGFLDILVNSENAMLYRNADRADGNILLKPIGNLSDRNIAGHTSSPATCDFDQDGQPDLLVGAEDGRIYYASHDACNHFTESELQGSFPQSHQKPSVILHEEFIFENPPTPQCHASTICKTSRGLATAWFGGTREGNKDVAIWTSYHDGSRWSPPRRTATGIQHENLRYPCWNPVLFQSPGDGPLLMFYKVGPHPRSWWGEMMISYDRGRTYRDPRRLPEGILGPVRCKPLLLDDNGLLCGSSTEHDGWKVHFERISLSQGLPSGAWTRGSDVPNPHGFNAIQPTIFQSSAGTLTALCRTKEGVIASTASSDNGASWSALAPTNLPNPNAGIDVLTLADGRHLLIYNHIGPGTNGWGRREILNLAISDDGLSWEQVFVLDKEKEAEFSYPALIQTDDGLVHATYTWKRTHIKHAVIDPSLL